jgi:hypothetical protein
MRKMKFFGFIFVSIGFLLAPALFSYSSSGQEDWSLRIGVERKDGHYRDSYNFIGISKDASLYYDAEDKLEPPTSPTGLCLYFPHSDWGVHSGRYASDKRPHIVDTETYEFVVEAGEHTQLRLYWQDIEDVPENYQLTLVDEEREIFIDIRKIKDYTFNCRPGYKNRFRVIITE